MKLSSPEFKNGYAIPSEYTCDGKNIPPELIIEDIPENTKTLALIMDDPDAPSGTFVHWLVWNIPKETKGIKKGEKIFYPQGKNDFQKNSYGGPCPPSGMHRYFFKLFALDASLDIIENSKKADLEEAMRGHIILQAHLVGTYQRVIQKV